MKRIFTIRKFLTLWLLLLFAFSITPRKYWHDLLADHTDFYGYSSNKEATVSKTGFNCQCESQVVSTPFIETVFHSLAAPRTFYQEYNIISYLFHFTNSRSTTTQRGPPALV